MTPLVIVELLPNDPNIKKDYNWRFVPLPIADNQVPSNILIIQLFNCYTSETKGLRIKDLLRKLQFLRKGEQLLWEPIDQRSGNRGALSGAKIGAIFCKITSRITIKKLKIGPRALFEKFAFWFLPIIKSGPQKWTPINHGQLGGSFGVHFRGVWPI